MPACGFSNFLTAVDAAGPYTAGIARAISKSATLDVNGSSVHRSSLEDSQCFPAQGCPARKRPQSQGISVQAVKMLEADDSKIYAAVAIVSVGCVHCEGFCCTHVSRFPELDVTCDL